MNSAITKQRIEILGESVIERSVKAFNDCELISSIVVVAKKEEFFDIKALLSDKFVKLCSVIVGGNTRAESAKAGFLSIPSDTEYVAIHDAARCLVTPDMIRAVVLAAKKHGAATAGTAVTDTVKRTDRQGIIMETVPRENLFAAATPQIFSTEIYKRAVEEDGAILCVTDDNMLVEKIGASVYCVDTGKENIKITTRSDLEYAEFIIRKRQKK